MKQVEIEYVSGTSQAGLSTRAVLGATIFGSDRSARQVKNWMSGNTKRQYSRRRLVWVCANGCETETILKVSSKSNIRNPLSSDQDTLKRELEHIDVMFGELASWIQNLNELTADSADLKKISDAEARKKSVEIKRVTTEVKRQVVKLGEIYEDEIKGRNTIVRAIINIVNVIMWGLGLLAIYIFIF